MNKGNREIVEKEKEKTERKAVQKEEKWEKITMKKRGISSKSWRKI